jgi:hypothetical protein
MFLGNENAKIRSLREHSRNFGFCEIRPKVDFREHFGCFRKCFILYQNRVDFA